MKKISFAFALTMLIAISLTSCKKCEVCTKNSEPEIKVCEDDYGSNTEYGLALDGLEVTGYECK